MWTLDIKTAPRDRELLIRYVVKLPHKDLYQHRVVYWRQDRLGGGWMTHEGWLYRVVGLPGSELEWLQIPD